MGILARIQTFLQRRWPSLLNGPSPFIDWFQVRFDDERVYVRAEPPGKEHWSQEFEWRSVIQICFAAEDLYVSDGIYVFTAQRLESYVIPIEARGGTEFWCEILRRKLFDANLAIEAHSSTQTQLFWWPPRPTTDEPMKPGN